MGGKNQAGMRGAKWSFAWFLAVSPFFVGFLVFAGVYWRYGPVCWAVAKVSGRAIWPDSWVVSLGRHPAGTTASGEVILRNYSDRHIEVIGAKMSCACTVVEGIPCVVPASGMVRIPVVVRLPNFNKVQTNGEQREVREQVIFLASDRGMIKKYPVVIQAELTSSDGH